MLSKVIFALKEWEGIDWQAKLEGVLEDLERHGVEWCFWDGDDTVQLRCNNQVLCIADTVATCKILTGKGFCVLPYRHEQNIGEIFHSDRYFYIAEQMEEMDYESLDMAYRRLAGLPWEILNTERCIVRETTVEDVDAFYQIYKEPDITRYMDNLCAAREEEIAYIEDYIKKVYYFYGYGMWTVVEKKSGRVIGRAGISWREGYALPELGFVIGVPWQGQGYAYEVCSAILFYAEEKLGIKELQTLVAERNEKSLGLVRKLGFVQKREITLSDGRRVHLFTRGGSCDKIVQSL
jgi:RimJ/RimL family protein N-acetyltransferase